MSTLKYCVLVCVVLVLSLPNLHAQTTGAIYGQVSDPSGAAVPEANITAENTGTGLVRKAVSSSVGSYMVPSLPPGSYKLTIERSGFKVYAQSGVTVIVGENARVDAALEIGAVTQTVEVSASAVRVDTQSTTVGTTVDNVRVQNLPLNGRNVLDLTQILPGVGTASFQTQVLVARGAARVNVSGSRNTQNNFLLDGTPMVNHMYNDASNLPSPDAIQEFRMLTNTFSAEYGRASGGVFLSVTKSGTNDFHGSVFEYLRNDALNARNFFAGATKPTLRQNQFGGSIGGPIYLPGYNGKDRTFFFFNYQGTRIRQQSLVTYFPPTAAQRAGDFSASATPIIDPSTGLQFPGNQIPSTSFDPLSVGILDAFVPLPNLPDGRYNEWLGRPTTGNDYTVKVDHQIGASDRLMFRYYRNDGKSSNAAAGNLTAPSLLGGQTNLVQTENLKWTRIFGPQLLNELSLSHLRMNWALIKGSYTESAKSLGGNFNYDGPDPILPNVAVSGGFSMGPLFPLQEPEDTYAVSDKLSWMHGRHSITTGTQIQLRGQHATLAQFVSAGSFSFTGNFTGNAFADYLVGRPASLYAQSYIEDVSRQSNYHFFVQDDFKVNSRLTLNFGLRYELNPPWVQVHDHTGTVSFVPGAQSQKIPAAPPGLLYPGDPGIPRGLFPTDKNNFVPRFGFAWDPTGKGKTAVRAAFAVFTSYVGAIMSSVNNQVEPYLVPISTVPNTFADPYDVANGGIDPFPYTADLQNPTYFYPMQAFSINPNFRDGYIEQWNLNIQHQLGDVLLKAGYYGLVGRKLSNLREANNAVYGPGATAANAQDRRPFYPQFYGSIADSISDANSAYHSLQFSGEKRWSRGYTLQLAYTFSKSIDNGSNAQVDAITCQNGNNCGAGEKGLSDFDQRHMLAINGVWELPFMKGNRVLGGWQLAGLTRITTGTPFSVLSGQDRALVGGGRSSGPQRADLVGDWRLDTGRSHGDLVAKYFDPAAFALPALGTFGGSGRNIVIGPGYSQTNVSLQKKFKLPGERGAFEFRADFFDVFNQVNFNRPLNNLAFGAATGRITSARDARIVQLALRYDF